MVGGTIYECSNGGYYGDRDVWKRLEAETWNVCCWDETSGTEWVETEDGELVVLTPISRNDLPNWVQVERAADGLNVTVDLLRRSRRR